MVKDSPVPRQESGKGGKDSAHCGSTMPDSKTRACLWHWLRGLEGFCVRLRVGCRTKTHRHSSSKDEISLDSLTPESCQLVKTPDPFWNVTRPEKCKRPLVWRKGQEEVRAGKPAAPPEPGGVSGVVAGQSLVRHRTFWDPIS